MKNKNKNNNIRVDSATIITRKNLDLNFGQTVTIVVWNDEFSDELIVIPDGEKKQYAIHFTECWTNETDCDHEAREKQLSKNDV